MCTVCGAPLTLVTYGGGTGLPISNETLSYAYYYCPICAKYEDSPFINDNTYDFAKTVYPPLERLVNWEIEPPTTPLPPVDVVEASGKILLKRGAYLTVMELTPGEARTLARKLKRLAKKMQKEHENDY
ncbi:MAG: hypothetical protein KKC03_13645 [Bacteroidetes bacterium]|nr:hypothetical protein [Bacteroidota bacterium]